MVGVGRDSWDRAVGLVLTPGLDPGSRVVLEGNDGWRGRGLDGPAETPDTSVRVRSVLQGAGLSALACCGGMARDGAGACRNEILGCCNSGRGCAGVQPRRDRRARTNSHGDQHGVHPCTVIDDRNPWCDGDDGEHAACLRCYYRCLDWIRDDASHRKPRAHGNGGRGPVGVTEPDGHRDRTIGYDVGRRRHDWPTPGVDAPGPE